MVQDVEGFEPEPEPVAFAERGEAFGEGGVGGGEAGADDVVAAGVAKAGLSGDGVVGGDFTEGGGVEPALGRAFGAGEVGVGDDVGTTVGEAADGGEGGGKIATGGEAADAGGAPAAECVANERGLSAQCGEIPGGVGRISLAAATPLEMMGALAAARDLATALEAVLRSLEGEA